jgi:CubicO group peptidase (beta-lactamase class C family)
VKVIGMGTFVDRKRSADLVVLVLLACTAISATSQSLSGQVERRAAQLHVLDRELKVLQHLLVIPGMSAAVVSDGQVIWTKGYGYADYERKIPAASNTPYPIASLTKTFSAALTMQLVEKGELRLDEPLSRYSDDFKGDTVRVRHILTHTSEGTPGQHYSYSGQRYWYLTRVLEKRTGKSLSDLVTTNVIEPVGMHRTIAGWGGDSASRLRHAGVFSALAKPYVLYGATQIVRAPYPPKDMNAAAGLISTVLDLAAYDAALDRGDLVTSATRSAMFTPTTSTDGATLPYGLGWFVQNEHGTSLVWHHGSQPSFSALFLKVPEKKLTFLLLANSDGLSHPFPKVEADGDVRASAFALAFLRAMVFTDEQGRPIGPLSWGASNAVFANEVARKGTEAHYDFTHEREARTSMNTWLAEHRAHAHRVVAVDRKLYAQLVGKYRFDDGYEVTISDDAGHLMNQAPGEEKLELFPMSPSEFFLKIADVRISFVQDTSGHVTGLVNRSGGASYPAKRVE